MVRPGILVSTHHNYLGYRLDLRGYMWKKIGFGLWYRLDMFGKTSVEDFYHYASN